jgi:GNAT superfamily N-acetyltransferase
MVDVTGMRLVQHPCRNLPIANDECVVPGDLERIDRRTALAWAKDLSVDEYLRRERFLKTRPFSRGLTVHALLADDDDTILASCESYRVPVAVPGRSTLGFGYGIASVFVDEAQRGHGYAADLLRRLHRQFSDEGAALVYLMSEIGPTLYAKLGYVTRPLQVRRFLAQPMPHRAQLIHASDLAQTLADLPPKTHSPLHIPPTSEQLDWHISRGRFYAQQLGRSYPDTVGARSGDAVIVWQLDVPKDADRLRILLLSSPAPGQDVAEVLAAAQSVAHQHGLPTVELWESGAQSTILPDGQQSPADDVPMILPLASDVNLADHSDIQRHHWL